MKFKVVELFSGIGAQSKALKNIGANYTIVATADWDIYANISYCAIHSNEELKKQLKNWEKIYKNTPEEREIIIKSLSKYTLSKDSKSPIKSFKSFSTKTLFLLERSLEINNNFADIKSIQADQLPEHNMITYSFPCQDLSLQGSQKGLIHGNSSSMIWEVIRILKDLNKSNRLPKYLIMENVKSLFSAKHEVGFSKWKIQLESLGYINHPFLLNSKYFDIPQNRERAFMVSELNQNKFSPPIQKEITKKTIKNILSDEWLEWKLPKGYIENFNPKVNKNGIAKAKILGYTTFNSEACAFTKDSISPTITATGALNRIKVIEGKKLRILNSSELWQLMGFDYSDWEKANNFQVIPERNLKKQAGNSIVVNILEEIFKNVK